MPRWLRRGHQLALVFGRDSRDAVCRAAKQTPLRLLPTSSRPERCPSSRCGARPELGAEPLGITAFLATGALDIERGAIAAASVAHLLDRPARAARILCPSTSSCPTSRAYATCASRHTHSPAMMLSRISTRRTTMPTFSEALASLGLRCTSDALDDIIALATNHHWRVDRLARTPWRTLAAPIGKSAAKPRRANFRTPRGCPERK